MANDFRVVVIGASAGGVSALKVLASHLPPDFPAAVLIVLHVGLHPSCLPAVLSWRGRLPAEHAVDGELLTPGVIRVAPPDRHLLLQGDRLCLTRGPKENHTRPAIDPLFRSVALAAGQRAIGVVLTGFLDDGTAGLQAIKSAGGTAVVQDPADAEQPSMPASALRYVDVDHCVPLADMPALLTRLARVEVTAPTTSLAEQDLAAHEQDLTFGKGDPMEHLDAIGHLSPFVCPDCNGALWEVAARPPRRY